MNRSYSSLKNKTGKYSRFCLEDNVTEKEINEGLILRQEIPTEDDPRMEYYILKHREIPIVTQLYNYILSCDKVNLHEIIYGRVRQKLRFDLDIKTSDRKIAQRLLDQLITGILRACREAYNTILDVGRDIRVCSSHGSHKFSYHLIISSFCVPSNLEASAFHDLAVKNIDKDLLKYVDKVTKNKQSLRILSAFKDDRQKIIEEDFLYNNQIIHAKYSEIFRDNEQREIYYLEKTLVTYCESCPMKYGLVPEQTTKKEVQNISDAFAIECLNLLANKMGRESYEDDEFPFSYRNTKGKIINLNRIFPNRCIVCSNFTGEDEIHDNDNPFLFVERGNRIFYICHRARSKGISYNDAKVFLGKI